MAGVNRHRAVERTAPLRPVRRRPRVAARTATALTSAFVLLVTGYGWNALGRLPGELAGGSGSGEAVDVLLVGLDGRTDAQGNPLPPEVLQELRTGDSGSSLTDTVMLLHVPADRSRAIAYSLPRDSFVAVPGQGEHKINAAYGMGKAQERRRLAADGVADQAELERRSSAAGRDLLVRTVQQLTGVDVDHVAEVNLLGFYELTSAIGGVEVCLNEAVDDPYSGAVFAAGRQEVEGGDALAFVRQRHGLLRGDLDRVQRQQAFLAGFARRVLSAGTMANPAKLQRLLDAVERSVVLDGDWNLLSFAAEMSGLAGGDIEFGTIPIVDPEYDTPDGQAVQVDPHQVRMTIARVNDGLPPTPPVPPALATSTVDVINGADVGGLAARTRDALLAADVPVGEVGNGTATARSHVLHHPDDADVARFVAEHLGGIPTTADPSQPAGELRVVLGQDFDDSDAEEFAAPAPLRLDGLQAATPAHREPDITADAIPCVN
ncbi:LCP family protein [Saccharopolyspora sp. NPDC047091]|uniref:LCP family protein n=1 Tax=Saccharopolyspora sp. NPDC047091 TaxID=3155924 RepID=UPI0033C5ACA8